MKDPNFPQNISRDESCFGFNLLKLDGFGRLRQSLCVVAKTLSSSEVLVKIIDYQGEIRYSHYKYGYRIINGEETPYKWYTIGNGWNDPWAFMEVYESGIKRMLERSTVQIQGVPYGFNQNGAWNRINAGKSNDSRNHPTIVTQDPTSVLQCVNRGENREEFVLLEVQEIHTPFLDWFCTEYDYTWEKGDETGMVIFKPNSVSN